MGRKKNKNQESGAPPAQKTRQDPQAGPSQQQAGPSQQQAAPSQQQAKPSQPSQLGTSQPQSQPSPAVQQGQREQKHGKQEKWGKGGPSESRKGEPMEKKEKQPRGGQHGRQQQLQEPSGAWGGKPQQQFSQQRQQQFGQQRQQQFDQQHQQQFGQQHQQHFGQQPQPQFISQPPPGFSARAPPQIYRPPQPPTSWTQQPTQQAPRSRPPVPAAWGQQPPLPAPVSWGQQPPLPAPVSWGQQPRLPTTISQQVPQQLTSPPGIVQQKPQTSQQPQGKQPQGKQQQRQPRQQESSRGEPGPAPRKPVEKITEEVSKFSLTPYSTATSGIPVRKGMKGRKIQLEVNYLELLLNKMIDVAYQYDVQFDKSTPKKFYRRVFDKFQEMHTGNIPVAFDGKAIAYSPIRLKQEILDVEFKIVVLDWDNVREKEAGITVKEAIDSEVELKSLRNYQNLRIFDKPMRALQCVDVVLRTAPSKSPKAVKAGRAFYMKPDNYFDLNDGYELYLGLFQAAILGARPFLNIDVCHKAFPSGSTIINLLQSSRHIDLSYPLDRRNCDFLDDYLKQLTITYRPPKTFGVPRQYKYTRLVQSASRQTFELSDGEITTVQKYFASRGYKLQYPELQCLELGNKKNYFPIELCEIPEGQATNRKVGENQVRNMIRAAATSTQVRKQKIMKLFQEFQYNRDSTMARFGISVGENFLNLDARIISPPRLEYSNRRIINVEKGVWRSDKVNYKEPAQMQKWAILITDHRFGFGTAEAFAKLIIKMGQSLQMTIEPNYDLKKQQQLDKIDNELEKFKNEGKHIVFVIISPRGDSYAKIKQVAELKCGLLTQCIKANTLERRMDSSTISNILLKVNAKLNGANHIVTKQDETAIMTNTAVMFIGADVTHPSPGQEKIPSVVGVAASVDLQAFRYTMRYRLQDPKKEIIEDMECILKELLEFYRFKNNRLPDRIIYFRDGVSDGQFEQVREVEFKAMDRACAQMKMNYKPKMTCIVVQKRHHTRFFPVGRADYVQDAHKFNNVPPGTIVDSVITHPCENQFFLVSHVSIQGTAKPTKYCLLRDDSDLNIDDLQAITYNLCHMFTRCNRAVSYPAPAYYAHLAAYRGRVYIEGKRNIDFNNLQKEYEKLRINKDFIVNSPMFFV